MTGTEILQKHPIYPQSGVIPFQIQNNQIEILLITSINSGRWIFPKGIIEQELTDRESARREAFEEAGIDGPVLNFLIGEYSYSKWGGTCHVKVFPLYVVKTFNNWPEADQRQRRWVSIEEARSLLNKNELKDIINNFDRNQQTILEAVNHLA